MISVVEPLEPRRFFAVAVNADAAARFQPIDGFGTSLAWWREGLFEQDAWRDAYFKDLGSSALRVDLNILALPGGDGDLATPVTMVDDLQTNIDAFDWNSVPTKRFGGVIQAAATKKLDDFKVVGSIWTPPHWMKGPQLDSTGQPKLDPRTGQPLPVLKQVGLYPNSVGGVLKDDADNLQQFGRYVAAYVKGYEQKFGVPMYAVSVGNEPAFDQVGTSSEGFNSAVYDPARFVQALKAVAAAFDHYGITTRIMGPEALATGQYTYTHYINAIKADPEAAAAIDIYNLHGTPTSTWWNLIKDTARPGWMTETSGEPATWDGALTLARNMQTALVQGNVSAWLYWQTSDGGTSPSAFTLTAGSDTNVEKFAAAKHFFRTIRPGSVRVAASPTDVAGVFASAFVHEQNKTLTSIVMNLSATPQTINLNIGGTNLSDFDFVRRSSAGALWQDAGPVAVANGVATFNLPARAMITLQGDIVAGQAPFLGSPFAVGAGTTTIQAEDFDRGGEGIAYHDVDIANLGKQYRPAERVDLQVTSDADGGHVVGWTKGGEWLEYTIDVATAGSYAAQFRVASTGTNGRFHVEVDGVDKTGLLIVPNTGGWQTFQTVTKQLDLPAGRHVLRVSMDAAGSTGYVGNFNWTKLTPAAAPPPSGQTPFKGTPFAVNVGGTSTTIQAEDFDNGGANVAFSDTTSTNQGGAYRNTAVDIQATADTGGGYNVGWTRAGEWLEYTIDVKTAGLATLAFRVAAASVGGAFHAEIDGVDVTGTLAVPSTGGWQNWATVTKTGVNLATGVHVLRLKMDAQGPSGYVGGFNWIRIS
jgi:O-glycosyl hydrolase